MIVRLHYSEVESVLEIIGDEFSVGMHLDAIPA